MSAVILSRQYQILCTASVRDALATALAAIPDADAGTFPITSALGPEAEPDAGYAITITHYEGGPNTSDALWEAALVVCASFGADVEIVDRYWVALDQGEEKELERQPKRNLRSEAGLFGYDEAYVPPPQD